MKKKYNMPNKYVLCFMFYVLCFTNYRHLDKTETQ